jgi:O-antigen/teichoic acid export membrane protein
MGIVFRQSAKNLIIVSFGAALGILITWLSIRYIPRQPLGFSNTLTTQAVTLSHLIFLGFSSTLIVYIHRLANEENKRRLLLTLCLGIPAILSVLVAIVYFLLKDFVLGHFQAIDIPLMAQYYMWLPVYAFLFIYQVMLEQYLGSQMKVAIAAFIREIGLRVLNVIIIMLFAFNYISFTAFLASSILIYVIPVAIYFMLALKTPSFGFSLRFTDFSKAEYKDLVLFFWYHLLLGISIMLITTMDILLLPIYDHTGFASVAVYRVAVILVSFLQLPLKALMPASFTVLAKAFTENDIPKAKDIFVRASINMLIPTLCIAALLCCNLHNALVVIDKPGYEAIIPVFLILFIGSLVNIATGMNDQVLTITNYYKFNVYLSTALIAVLYGLIRFMVPHYGMVGAAWSTTITVVVFNAIKCVFVWKKLNMQPFTGKTALALLAALPAFAAGYFLPRFFEDGHHIFKHAAYDATLRSALIVAVYAAMLLWLKPSPDLQEYMATIKKNKRLF